MKYGALVRSDDLRVLANAAQAGVDGSLWLFRRHCLADLNECLGQRFAVENEQAAPGFFG